MSTSDRIHPFNQPLNNWDVSKVENMYLMFGVVDGTNGQGAFNQPLNNWDVSNVTNMAAMFKGHKKFDQDLSNWDVSNVQDFGNMFDQTRPFNNGGAPLTC